MLVDWDFPSVIPFKNRKPQNKKYACRNPVNVTPKINFAKLFQLLPPKWTVNARVAKRMISHL
jgi:hypothetical protein